MAREDIDLIRSDLKDASEVHHRLNSNNPIVSRCRECLHNFLELYNSFKATTAPNDIGAWGDLAISLQQPDFQNVNESQMEASSILQNTEHDFSWFDMETFPGTAVQGIGTDLQFSNRM